MMNFNLKASKMAALKIFICLLHIGLICAQSEGDSRWGYSRSDGPEIWCDALHEGECCSVLRQSPININSDDIKFMSEEVHFFNYNTTAKRIVLANNGRTAVVHMFGSSKVPYLRLGSKKTKFGLDSFHFHWGSHSNNGSEHSIDGHRYPMEMHLVHINKKYETLEVARLHPDGIAVLAIFFEISEKSNSQFEKLVKGLSNVKTEGDHVDIKQNFVLDLLIPKNLDVVYAYKGSLTTPPCSEAVTWFVIEQPNMISEEQITVFRHLRTTVKPLANTSAEIDLADNFRPQQDLHQRMVFKMKGVLNS